MAGAEDFCEIERWAKQKLDFLRRLLPFDKGVPSHDALNDVMNTLPASLFAECFTTWVAPQSITRRPAASRWRGSRSGSSLIGRRLTQSRRSGALWRLRPIDFEAGNSLSGCSADRPVDKHQLASTLFKESRWPPSITATKKSLAYLYRYTINNESLNRND